MLCQIITLTIRVNEVHGIKKLNKLCKVEKVDDFEIWTMDYLFKYYSQKEYTLMVEPAHPEKQDTDKSLSKTPVPPIIQQSAGSTRSTYIK